MGVIDSSITAFVQPEMERMRPAEVSNQCRGIFVTDPVVLSKEDLLAADAETEKGKPVIAISTASYWHAVRALGGNDKTSGLGRLLKEF